MASSCSFTKHSSRTDAVRHQTCRSGSGTCGSGLDRELGPRRASVDAGLSRNPRSSRLSGNGLVVRASLHLSENEPVIRAALHSRSRPLPQKAAQRRPLGSASASSCSPLTKHSSRTDAVSVRAGAEPVGAVLTAKAAHEKHVGDAPLLLRPATAYFLNYDRPARPNIHERCS